MNEDVLLAALDITRKYEKSRRSWKRSKPYVRMVYIAPHHFIVMLYTDYHYVFVRPSDDLLAFKPRCALMIKADEEHK